MTATAESGALGARIYVREGALGSAAALTRGCHPAETGGLLIGLEHDGAVWVWDAIGVRGNVLLSPHGYDREHGLAAACLDTYLSWGPSGGAVGYVGEWHSHPTIHSASFQDLTELSDIAMSRQGRTALIVVGADPENTAPFGYLCDSVGVPVPAEVTVVAVGFGKVVESFGAGD